MRARLGTLLAVAVAVALAAAAAPARAEEPVYLPWTALLPALPSAEGHSGGPQPGCRDARLRCVRRVIRRLERHQARFGCDHRGVFATTYLELTKEIYATLRDEPGFFADRDALIFEDVLFARFYFQVVRDEESGRAVAPAWRIAFDEARAGDLTGTGDMLLGINAHVQNDMPFVLAAISLRDARGVSRKGDHEQGNVILDRAFARVVAEVARRYDPITELQTTRISPVSDIFGMELVRTWREGVWRNAERLVNARSDSERRQVAESIQLQAAAAAQMIRAGTLGPPGYRAQRDAYCASR